MPQIELSDIAAESTQVGGALLKAARPMAEEDTMTEKRTWVCLSCGAAYEVRPDLLPLRCWDCRARLVEMPRLALERKQAADRHPSSSSS